jgi:hypothetical protein
MSKSFRPLIAFLTLSLAIFACVLPIPAAPQSSGTATPPFSSDQVGTVVAMTLTGAAPASTPGTDGSGGLLPRSFYYLGADGAGLLQVFWIERDGTTQHQITSEPVNVGDHDRSPTDGSGA